MINQLNMADVKRHYDRRVRCHERLLILLNDNRQQDYLNLALGITESQGNYSASEHHLGERILANNNPVPIVNLARSFLEQENRMHMLRSIHNANLPYLAISVGSEMAMMLRPDFFWVGNVRTIWTHLLHRHSYNLTHANEELRLYREQNREQNRTSEMEYLVWRDIYPRMQNSIENMCEIANDVAINQGVISGSSEYLWFDAIASSLYERFAN